MIRVGAGGCRTQSEGLTLDVPVATDGHPAAPPRGTAGLEVLPLLERPGVRAVGEVGTGTRSVWSEALGRLARRREDLLYVEMSQVTFIDVAGVTDLVMTAQSMHGGQRIRVEKPPAQVVRILEIFWPEWDGIEVAP